MREKFEFDYLAEEMLGDNIERALKNDTLKLNLFDSYTSIKDYEKLF
jgi:hypothetical protein